MYVQQWGFYQFLQIAAGLLRAQVKVELKYWKLGLRHVAAHLMEYIYALLAAAD